MAGRFAMFLRVGHQILLPFRLLRYTAVIARTLQVPSMIQGLVTTSGATLGVDRVIVMVRTVTTGIGGIFAGTRL